jgi:hypothetical protein
MKPKTTKPKRKARLTQSMIDDVLIKHVLWGDEAIRQLVRVLNSAQLYHDSIGTTFYFIPRKVIEAAQTWFTETQDKQSRKDKTE